MGRGLNRGDIWFAQAGRQRRPMPVLPRGGVLDVRALVTVAEVTTPVRGLLRGLHRSRGERESVAMLTEFVGAPPEATMDRVCAAIAYALDC